MQLLFILIAIILAAILGQRFNTPEVKNNISEIVAKIKDAGKAPPEEQDPKKKQEALTKGLETSLTEIEDALKEMANVKNSASDGEVSLESKNIVTRVIEKLFSGEPESPKALAEKSLEKAQEIVAELKQTQQEIAQVNENTCEPSP